ncbi:MAG: EF-P beta-lysylation protein EpmB, partial [Dokdonella sp.]
GIAHVRRLRIHSRLPIVLPQRVDQELLAWLERLPIQKILVVHANHANEIDETVAAACAELTRAGVTLLNQSVLLRRVNDSIEALVELSERLLACSILPYYLHQLDRVAGTAHFEVADALAIQLVEQMRGLLPGYLVPRLVREMAGAASKQPV